MYRGPLVFATLLGGALSQCDDCNFDVRALEEFTTDWELVSVVSHDASGGITLGTGPAPDSYVKESGILALHARNLQVALTANVKFGFALGNGPHPLDLNGKEMHEQLHINGATGQASWHLASDALNMCIQLDGLPPMAQIMHDDIEMHLHQAEQAGPMMAQQHFAHYHLDGQDDIGPARPPSIGPRLLFTQSSEPAFVWPFHHPNPLEGRVLEMMHPAPDPQLLNYIGYKFSNYENSVGNAFGVRACEITAHSSTQSFLAENPDMRDFVRYRIAQHQRRLQAVLQPDSLNTRFNFMNLDNLADLMVPEPTQDCASEELAQVPGTTFSAFQVAAVSVSSFVMAVVFTSAAVRKRTATPADDYHQVAA